MSGPFRNTTADACQIALPAKWSAFFEWNNERNEKSRVEPCILTYTSREFSPYLLLRAAATAARFFFDHLTDGVAPNRLCCTVVFEADAGYPVHKLLFTAEHFNFHAHKDDGDIAAINERKTDRIFLRGQDGLRTMLDA